MAIREGRWDCPSCGSTAIYGRFVDCPGCGKPRPAGVRFYLTADAPVITEPERLKEAHAGPDWICLHCEASNRATLDQCGGCGAARGSSPTQPVHTYGDGEVPRTGTPAAPLEGAGTAERGGGGSRRRGGGLVGYTVAAAMLGIVVVSAIRDEMPERTPAPVAATVEAARWERAVTLEARILVRYEGWELPDSAVDVAQSSRVRDHRREVEGYQTITSVMRRKTRVAAGERRVWESGSSSTSCTTRDLGNGYFEEDCEESSSGGEWVTETVYRDTVVYDTLAEKQPIYRDVPVHATYYTYRLPEWRNVKTVQAAGDQRTTPAWPEVTVPPDHRAQRTETYQLVLRTAAGARVPLMVGEEEWRSYRPGQRLAYAPSGGIRLWDRLLPPDSLPECRRWRRGRGKAPPASLGCSPRTAKAR